jgi:uncharacterized protein
MGDLDLKQLLKQTRTIAVVGHSDKPWRDSYRIGVYLRAEGYKIFPVNPALSEVLGLKVYASLAEVPEPIDLVDVFRATEFVPQVVADTIAVKAKAIWTQLGVYIAEADKARLAEAGIQTVENLCIKVEHQRLGIRQAGD